MVTWGDGADAAPGHPFQEQLDAAQEGIAHLEQLTDMAKLVRDKTPLEWP